MRDGQRISSTADLSALFGTGSQQVTAELPPGEVLADQSTRAGGSGTASPLCWISDEPPSSRLIARLRGEHHRTGLWPLLLCDDTEVYGERCTVGVVPPEPLEHIEKWSARDVMQRIWDGLCQVGEGDLGPAYDLELLAPFAHTCPGMAPTGGLLADPDILANQQIPRFVDDETRLALVPVRRGADVLPVLGWSGAANHVSRTAGLSALLRSWEDRFGARVLRLGPDRLDVSVAAPPTAPEHAETVAAEHWTFCPDRVLQDSGSIAAHAQEIRGRRSWSFWWE